MSLLGLLLFLILVGVVLQLVPMDPTIKRVALIICVVVVLFAFFELLAPSFGRSAFRCTP